MRLCIIIPTLNEEVTVEGVVRDFRKEFPKADVIVYDGNSTDDTRELAKKAGAKVYVQESRGKGGAVREAFQKLDYDIYLLADGDGTYRAEDGRKLVEAIEKRECDMAVGLRTKEHESHAFSMMHVFGNKTISHMLSFFFRKKLGDVLSGYRAMTRSLVKDLILVSSGFEIETEMTVKTLMAGYRIKEIPIKYGRRPEGSVSKLSGFGDGYLIVSTIIRMFRDYKPLMFFSIIWLICWAAGLFFGITVVIEYMNTGLVTKLPSAVLSALLMIIGLQFLGFGLILDSFNNRWKEVIQAIRTK